MTYGEAYRIVQVLTLDPSSAVAAAVQGWDYPVTREAMAVMDLFDLQHESKARRKPKPYLRPWSNKSRKVIGRTRLTRRELSAILDRHRQEVPADG